MDRNKKFWTLLAIFQVAFGLTVFAATREIYRVEPAQPVRVEPTSAQPAVDWSGMLDAADGAGIGASQPALPKPSDPAEIARMADVYFSARDYARAAEMYERLLEFDPQDVEVHNNLGLTLHYIGRSDEALRWLNQGTAIDPGNQRIWLTLGFVASETGDLVTARDALGTATRIGSDEAIRQSAERMLEALP